MDEATIRKAVYQHFDRLEDDFCRVVEDIVDRVVSDYEGDPEDDEFYESVWSAIDDGLIYTKDQWAVLEHYCTPSEADFQKAMEEFEGDVSEIAKDLLSEDEEED